MTRSSLAVFRQKVRATANTYYVKGLLSLIDFDGAVAMRGVDLAGYSIVNTVERRLSERYSDKRHKSASTFAICA